MRQRVNITLAEETIALLNRVTDNRSRFIEAAVLEYAKNGRVENRRGRLEEGTRAAPRGTRNSPKIGSHSRTKHGGTTGDGQVRSIDKIRLAKRLGRAGDDTMRRVDRAILVNFGIEPALT